MDNIIIKTTINKQLNFRLSLYPNGRLYVLPISESLFYTGQHKAVKPNRSYHLRKIADSWTFTKQ
ncbi:hypothetical protein N824_08300 [Pedobacter sp. V48]|nr:hypothetical protein N824_08300 [Pedobacter sp. V48]